MVSKCALAAVLAFTILNLQTVWTDPLSIEADFHLINRAADMMTEGGKATIAAKLKEKGIDASIVQDGKRSLVQSVDEITGSVHWCCKKRIESEAQLVHATLIGTKIISAPEYRKECNFWGECEDHSYYVTYLAYYTYNQDVTYTKIDLGFEPCEARDLICCTGYHYFRPLDECQYLSDWLTFAVLYRDDPDSLLWTRYAVDLIITGDE